MSNHPSDAIIRSFPILLSYLCLAASLTIHSSRTIHSRYQFRQKHNDWAPAQRRQFFIFAILAALSLGATWYYMFAFFAHSYRSWEAQAGRAVPLSLVPRLEMWLRNTKLFREAWETVIETPARFWWSGQIFLWTTGWSVFLGLMARRYRVPHGWMYMLLGQIVAISFAQNLFFATILVSKPVRNSRDKGPRDSGDGVGDWLPPLALEVLPITVSLLSTALVPFVAHTSYFMLILLVPHLLLFVPVILRPSRGGSGRRSRSARDAVNGRYAIFLKYFLLLCVILQAHSTYAVFQDVAGEWNKTACEKVYRSLLAAVYEHPAVSSVSWDVIFCSVGAVAWIMAHGRDRRKMLGGSQGVEAQKRE